MSKIVIILSLFIGTSAFAENWRPRVVATAKDGTLFVADGVLPGIWERGGNGEFVLRFQGAKKDRSPLRTITSLAVADDGTLFAGDSATGEIYQVDRDASPKPLSGGSFEIPTGLAIAEDGTLFVCDLRLNMVARLPRTGGKPETIARVLAPRGLAIAEDGDLYVLSMREDQLVKLSLKGEVKTIVKGTPFQLPLALAVDRRSKDVWVADGDGSTVWKVSPQGKTQAFFGPDVLKRPVAIATDTLGNLFAADAGSGKILRASPNGKLETIWNGPKAIDPGRKTP